MTMQEIMQMGIIKVVKRINRMEIPSIPTKFYKPLINLPHQ